MFQIRFTTKRELALWMAMIEDLKARVSKLETQIVQERDRADAAVNLLLAKTQGMIIQAQERGVNEFQREKALQEVYDMFDEGEGKPSDLEARTLKDIQG